MLIQGINSISFCANFNSPKLKFSRDDFFIHIRGYGKNTIWADKAINAADSAANLIRKNTAAENIIRFISQQIREAANVTNDVRKKSWSGLLREPRDNWQYNDKFWGRGWITPYTNKKYKGYSVDFENVDNKPLTNPFEGRLDLTRPDVFRKQLVHGDETMVNSALELIIEKCKNIFSKYIKNDITEKDLSQFNEEIAEVRWIMAHSTPFLRGSDAIANILMRAMYKSAGVKSYPIKRGISLDLQAYCTELKDYKKNFTSYFIHSPEIIE